MLIAPRSLAILALTVFTLAAQTRAASPSLSALRPVGGQRGTEVEVSLTGARVGDAQELLFYQPGLSVAKLEKVDDNHVKATVRIAPDSPLGLHDLRLRTATGISELRTFSVGLFKEVSEVEPNNDFTAPQPIDLGVVVNGVADNEDVDHFAVKAHKGQRITAEVEGIRVGITHFDPYVAILNARRFELDSTDDAALVWQDGFASIVAPEDGTYIIQVRESAYAGNGACLYRLHVGDFPRATATIPAGGKLGETLEVTWIGDVLGERKTSVTLPAILDKNFGLLNQDERGLSPYPNPFRLAPYGNVIEVEPNDDHATATPFTAPLALNGIIGSQGDTDHFVFSAKNGQTFDVRAHARTIRSPLDPVLYVAKKGGGAFVGNDDSAGPDSYIRFTADQDTDYVISLVDHLKKGGADYAYRIEISPVEPKLSLSLASESINRGTGTIAAAVPKGNRQAILVNAGRADFGGDLVLAAEGLPEGLSFEADTMPASIATMPVLLTAKADAPVAGRLATLTGRHADANVKIPSEFTHTAELVLGQNNIPFWTRTVDRMGVAVTDEAPYSIEIVEPKVPLVRGGSMGLKVVAKRQPGFTAPISISLPWNPPGVGSSGGVAIPENQNEAIIPINADGGAELRTWKIVVNGYSNAPSGPIMVSSQLAPLTIAQQYLTFAFQAAAVEQGKETDLVIQVAKATDWEGPAEVTLIGLPNKATTEPATVTKDTKELIFKIKTDPATPAGNHNNLFCQVKVPQSGDSILHNLGTGQLRVDVPLPPKPNAPAPMPEATPAAPAPAPPAEKRLTRLEKLRQEHKERAKAAATAGQPPATEGGGSK